MAMANKPGEVLPTSVSFTEGGRAICDAASRPKNSNQWLPPAKSPNINGYMYDRYVKIETGELPRIRYDILIKPLNIN